MSDELKVTIRCPRVLYKKFGSSSSNKIGGAELTAINEATQEGLAKAMDILHKAVVTEAPAKAGLLKNSIGYILPGDSEPRGLNSTPSRHRVNSEYKQVLMNTFPKRTRRDGMYQGYIGTAVSQRYDVEEPKYKRTVYDNEWHNADWAEEELIDWETGRSIKHQVGDKKDLSSAPFYSPYVIYGTRFNPPNPFIQRAMLRTSEQVNAAVAEGVIKFLKKAGDHIITEVL